VKIRGAPAEVGVVRRFESWPRCTCLRCIALDLRYPNDGYQLAFWRYEPVTKGPNRKGDVYVLQPEPKKRR
jgi:hypothetical protein